MPHSDTTVPVAKKPAGILPWLTWPFSLVLPVALLLLVVTFLFDDSSSLVELTIQDAAGRPLPSAQVLVDDALFLSDAEGKVRLETRDAPQNVTVRQDGYTTMVGKIDRDTAASLPITLESADVAQAEPTPPTTAALLTQGSGNTPAPGASSSPEANATPPPASATARHTDEVAGVIMDTDGKPIAQGWVTDGKSFVFSDADGAFVFDKGAVASDATLRVFGEGYLEKHMAVPSDGARLEIALDLQPIKGIYYNPNISNTQEDVDRLIDIVNTTEVNAIVVDIKEELVFYDSQVQFFRDAGVVSPVIDLPAILKQFQDNHIYTIARLVVFKDSAIAEKYPDLAVKDSVSGGLWRDMNGIAWVNPMLHELWDHNIDLAYEAATMGFDEIQYDYVRFPTDGDLSRVVYGIENTQENRQNAIEKFLQRSRERLIPTGVRLSADIFGYTVVVPDDLGIGQNLERLADHVDYLSPMIYPSHWPNGSLALDGHPNDFPYETIEISMGLAKQRLNGNGLKLRPWLQDFNMPGMKKYGAPEVRAQIDAVEDLGLAGWLIWDPNNWYHDDAFKPEAAPGAAPQATPAATPQTVSGGYSGTRGRRRG